MQYQTVIQIGVPPISAKSFERLLIQIAHRIGISDNLFKYDPDCQSIIFFGNRQDAITLEQQYAYHANRILLLRLKSDIQYMLQSGLFKTSAQVIPLPLPDCEDCALPKCHYRINH